jgi:hypothetical protein
MRRTNAFTCCTASFALLLLLTLPRVASGADLSPGDILVAAQGPPGTIHHFSSFGVDLGGNWEGNRDVSNSHEACSTHRVPPSQ